MWKCDQEFGVGPYPPTGPASNVPGTARAALVTGSGLAQAAVGLRHGVGHATPPKTGLSVKSAVLLECHCLQRRAHGLPG